MVVSPSALAASSRCKPSTSTKRAPSTLTRIGDCRPLSRMLVAISSTHLFESSTPLDRNVDVSDCDGFALIMIEPKYSKSGPAIFFSVGVLRRQLLQQRLRLLQIARVKPLGEPPVHRSKQFASLLRLPLVTPEARESGGGAKFEQECALLLRDL